MLLLRQYLDYLQPELKQPEPITAAAINNYVRTRLLPEPRKKRYYRVHIAYLIMICTLKQALRLSELQTLLPGDLPEDEVRRTYDAYVRRHQLCAQYFIDQVRLTAAAMFDREVTMELAVRDTPEMITSAAILSGFARLFAEKLLLLEGKTLASASSLGLEAMPKIQQAEKVGELVAKKALEAGVTSVVFDRNGYLYHGRVKSLADAARKGGLNF